MGQLQNILAFVLVHAFDVIYSAVTMFGLTLFTLDRLSPSAANDTLSSRL